MTLANTQQIILMDGDEEILKEIAVKKEKMPTSRKIFILCMMIIQIVHFCVFFIYINFDTIFLAFQKVVEVKGDMQTVWCGFDNFAKLFSADQWGTLSSCITNSLILFAINNFVILPIAIFCAYIFFKKLPMSGFFRVVFFLPSIISIVVLVMAFKMVLGPGGPFESLEIAMGIEPIKNGLFGNASTAMMMVCIYCVWAGIGYDVVFMSGAISRVPEEVFESGQLDGVGMWKELFYLVLPLIMPTVSTLFINGIAVIFTIFLQPQLLIGPGATSLINMKTGTIAMYIVDNSKDYALKHMASATGVLFSVIGIPLVLAVRKILDKITPDITF